MPILGPPDKFPAWVDLSSYSTAALKADALGTLYATFYTTYGVWPTAAITCGTVVFIGAYA